MAALFIIVTLAAIATYLLTISTGQLEAGIQDEQGARAYQAARTGIDWGAFQVLRNTSCVASQTLTLPQGFWSKVDCSLKATENEAGIPINVYLITATGCNRNACGPANIEPTYVERQLQLTVTR